MFYKLEPRPKNANCPHCNSTETFVSLYKENRYCNNCDRTYNQSDEIAPLTQLRGCGVFIHFF